MARRLRKALVRAAHVRYSAAVLIYPAIDLMNARAVRLEQGRAESAKIYSDAPWELVAGFEAAGAARVHVVDLDAAFSGGSQTQPRDDCAHRRLHETGGRSGGRHPKRRGMRRHICPWRQVRRVRDGSDS
jgi:hypothetical protein